MSLDYYSHQGMECDYGIYLRNVLYRILHRALFKKYNGTRCTVSCSFYHKCSTISRLSPLPLLIMLNMSLSKPLRRSMAIGRFACFFEVVLMVFFGAIKGFSSQYLGYYIQPFLL